jgi:hypothetical protein
MVDNDAKPNPITVMLPPEPPVLTPGAARALLRLLVKAYEKQAVDEACPGAADSDSPDSQVIAQECQIEWTLSNSRRPIDQPGEIPFAPLEPRGDRDNEDHRGEDQRSDGPGDFGR